MTGGSSSHANAAEREPSAEPEAESRGWLHRLRRLGPLLAVALLVFAVVSLHHELRGLTWLEIRTDLGALPRAGVLLALLFTVANYAILTNYDALALSYIGSDLPRRRSALAATLGYAFSQGLGFPLLTGAPIRYRLYSGWGLSAFDIGRIIASYTTAFWIGFAATAGVAFVLAPVEPPAFTHLPSDSVRFIGIALLAVVGTVLVWTRFAKDGIRLGALTLPVPGPRLVTQQILTGAADWITGSLVLWALLPDGHALGFGEFLTTYLLAQSLGVVSTVPGGLGVFEAVMLSFLPHGAEHSRVLASLLVFRVIYYFVPLFCAVLALGFREVRDHPHAMAPGLRAARVVSQLVPAATAVLAFVLGAVLLLSGSVPVPAGKLRALDRLIPLPVLELSHFTASILGAGLMLVARGLQRRLDGAYHFAFAGLLLGAVLTVTRDLHVLASVFYLAAAVVLYASRREFYRKASLLDEPFSRSWVAAISAMTLTAVWLGGFAFRHVEYANDLWWRFTFVDDAPRFLRATVGVAVTFGLFVLARLLRPAPPGEHGATPELLERLEPVVDAAAQPEANLVFLGDKQVLASPSGRSFLMYAVAGRTWAVMGDPVGEEAEFEALGWMLRDLADRAGGRLVFYEASAAYLPLYIDLGLVFYKLGEDARVPLTGFSLDGSHRSDLRQAKRRLEREGGLFDVVPRAEVPALLPALRAISDEWLATKNVREKRFSLGSFDERYLEHFPCAVIRVEGEIVAFANLWTSSTKDTLSVDLMRYGARAPKGVMDALFTHLLLWGAAEGYQWFSLGMAPFSGIESHRLASLWQKVGATLFRYGEQFYNFQGLRSYKEKFSPVWEPRYLAAPPGPGIARSIADLTTLISGGLRGAVMR